ncbi:MAG: hypothetical protein NTZ15_17680 [Burkholderiales bacterium]|nr:hypothetical protein [Burkholderiales bacterium]
MPATSSQLPDSLHALLEAERQAVAARRRLVLGEVQAQADPAALDLPRVGLALSGGGVRSATFALGLLRGLAQNRSRPAQPPAAVQRDLASDGLLGRVDYLSTVSGGGYTGAMWGRLVASYGIQRAQALMAGSGSPVLQWLRRNGRYLTPAGSRDTGIAVATYWRAWLAIHMEFMFASILLGALVIAPHLLQHRQRWLDAWAPWGTPWWVFALLFYLALTPGLVAGYWAVRDAPPGGPIRRRGPGLRGGMFLLVAALCTVLLWVQVVAVGWTAALRDGPGWLNLIALGMASLTLGQGCVVGWLWLSRGAYSLRVALVRNQLTTALRAVLLGTLGLLLVGLLDWCSWWLLEALLDDRNLPWLWRGVGVGGLVLLVLRNLVQPLQQMAAETSKQAQDWLPRIVNWGSQMGFGLLVMFWLVLLQWFVFSPITFPAFNDIPATLRLLLLLAAWAMWMLLTAGNAQMANTSSLHSFYRARLARAYLAVGNPARRLDQPSQHHPSVTQVVEGDDQRLGTYAPELQGGPLHLVNTCLNQTRDDRSGLYNADRKGAAVTASWRGFEVGPDAFMASRRHDDAGSLGRWVAVSGAAASSGAGAYTSRGLALLLYLMGVRLGYWMRAPQEHAQLRWGSRLAWLWSPKPMMLASEASATFFGLDRPWWYLSDGGHFENTGVYALLKRELDFIILSDASCDANYEFSDLENLVRKARIDFGAEIDFYSHAEAARKLVSDGSGVTVLSPEDMANNHSCRGVMLARIRYRERPGDDGQPMRPEGTLLVVKPNLHDALDVDVLAYAQKHPSFPHESTVDQSFDEAQWESYHRLGEDFGRALTDDWLGQLPGWRSKARHGMDVAARLSGARVGDAAPSEPVWRRGARAAAIGTTLGLGASGTLVLSLWQVQDQLQRQSHDEQTETRQLFIKVSEGLAVQDWGCPKLPEHLLTQTLDLLQRRDSPAMRPLDAKGVDRLVQQMAQQCEKPVGAAAEGMLAPDCRANYQRMQEHLCSEVKRPLGDASAMNYWLPRDGPEQQALDADKKWKQLAQYWDAQSVWALLRKEPDVVASLPAPVGTPGPVIPVKPGSAASAAAPVEPGMPSADELAQACSRPAGKTLVYMQVYDAGSLLAANTLRERIKSVADQVAGATIQIAPVENVVRSADLRQQRRPVPWPRATFLLHDRGDLAAKNCAQVLARFVGEPWSPSGTVPWIRDLPDRLPVTPGVLELWLPVSTSLNLGAASDVEAARLARLY